MANFNAIFAGCESFMESDIETDDEGVYTSEGDALEAESVAEDVGTEGGEIAGEAETEDTKAEAANMVFDQLINMYMHVKNYGVDRTFLSLYNSNGQLNKMIGYRFPSCESIDSVGNVNSSASRAFIAAMESDSIFSKIWTWIKETAVKVYNFFIKVMDWFREACGNLDMRVGKLYKYFSQSAPKKWSEIKDKSVKYVENSKVSTYENKCVGLSKAVAMMQHDFSKSDPSDIKFKAGKDLAETMSNAAQAMSSRLVEMSNRIKSESTRTERAEYWENSTASKEEDKEYFESHGRTKDKDDKDGVEALKKYIDRINKDLVDPLADAISDLSFETKDLNEIGDNESVVLSIGYASDVSAIIIETYKFTKPTKDDDANENTIKRPVLKMLINCQDALKGLLQQKHAMQMMELANKQVKQLNVQTSRLEGNGSGDYETHKDAKLSMMGIVKANSIFARITTLNEKVVAKCCTLAASLQSCVKANGATS